MLEKKPCKNLFCRVPHIFAFQKLFVEVTYLLMKFFSWNRKNTGRNVINKQNTNKHISHTEKGNIGKV